MDTREAVETLAKWRHAGANRFWFGGGEPTLRRDIFRIITAAKRLGYETIKVQTNGMLLAYAEYAKRLQAAGADTVSFSIKSHEADEHDRLTQTPGCHKLLCQGIAEASNAGLNIEADVLVYASTVSALPELVASYTALGIEKFTFWMFHAASGVQAELEHEVPNMGDLVAALRRIRGAHPDVALTSLHTPPCTLGGELEDAAFSPAGLDMVIANPGGDAFRLEESPIEGGTYLPRCAECSARERCGGLRAEYLKLHGDALIAPLP